MNILFFIHCLIGGGAERVTVNLSEALVRRGHNVTIGLTEEIIDYQIDERVKISVLRPPIGYNGRIVLLRKFISLINRVSDYCGIKRIIKKSKPDVIVASWGSKTGPIISLHGRIPVIASEHNTFDREHTPDERRKRFFTNKKFNKVVVLTEYDKVFTKNFLDNTCVIPNPLSFAPLSYEEFDSIYPRRRNILACGRINAYKVKGFDNLIIAFSKIAMYYPGWDLDIAGAGTEQNIQVLKELANVNGVEDRVHFLGFCNNISEVMKQHSIFVLSSRSEGFGMVITEAMAMGCPCISYALTGPSEIINNGYDGILVDNQNIERLSEEMSNLIGDEKLRRKLSMNALNSVTRYSVEVITDKWVNLFKEVIENG